MYTYVIVYTHIRFLSVYCIYIYIRYIHAYTRTFVLLHRFLFLYTMVFSKQRGHVCHYFHKTERLFNEIIINSYI